MIQPGEFYADPSCRSAPTESNKLAFTSRSRCAPKKKASPTSHLYYFHSSGSTFCLSPSPALPPLSLCLLPSWPALSPHITCLYSYKQHNVANGFATKVIRVKMHHLFFLIVKCHLAASTAGEPGRLMCVSHRPRSQPPEEKVNFLLWLGQEVCVCMCMHVYFHTVLARNCGIFNSQGEKK